MIEYNEEYQVVVDDMGMPITKDCAIEMIASLTEYLRLDPHAIANRAELIATKRYPNMVEQMKLKYTKYV